MLRKNEKELKLEERKGYKPSTVMGYIKFSLCLIYCFTIFSLVYAQQPNLQTATPQEIDIEKGLQDKRNITSKSLDQLEEKIFHQKFSDESSNDRLSRIEEFVFGKKTSNQIDEIRLNKITNALQDKSNETEQEKIQVIQPQTIPQNAIASQKDEQNINKQQKIIYPEPNNSGIIGAINEIEVKIFNKTFEALPFPQRVANLEEKILTRNEITKNSKKPLLERVNILVKKANLPISKQTESIIIPPPSNPQNNIQNYNANTLRPSTINQNQQNNNYTQSYTIDPRNGFLINEQTGEVIKDGYGNPIKVRIPQQVTQQPQYNYANPNQLYPNQNSPYGALPPQQQYGLPGQQGQFPYDLFFNQGGLDPSGEQNNY